MRDNVHMYDNKIEQVSSGSIFRSFSDSKANLSGSDRQKKNWDADWIKKSLDTVQSSVQQVVHRHRSTLESHR